MQTNWQPDSREVEKDCSVRHSTFCSGGEVSLYTEGAGSIAIDENGDRGPEFGGGEAEAFAGEEKGRLGHFHNK